jgi:uncharacterized integral membrane protein
MAGDQRTPAPGTSSSRSGADQARLALWALLIVLVTVFAVLNTGEVEVNWIFGTFATPLILLIAVCLIAGFALGAGAARLGERRRRRAPR